VESAVLLASVPAVPAFVGLPVTPPVQVISQAVAGMTPVPVPVIAAAVIATDVPPVSVLELRNVPARVAVFVQATNPEIAAPTLQLMLLPVEYVTPMVA
jgi:hypothetical protein